MATEATIGPVVTTGNLSPIQLRDWEAGPSLFADGSGITDDRLVSLIGAFPNKAYGLNSSEPVLAIDSFPTAAANNNIVNAQGAGSPSGTSLTLATGTVQSAVSNVPIVPWVLSTDVYGNRFWTPPAFATSNLVTAGLTLDFGMCAGTTFTSSTVTLTTVTGPGFGTVPVQYAGQVVNKNQIVQLQTSNHIQPEMMFVPGQWIIVANAGAGGTVPLVAQVLAIDYIQHFLYVSVAASTAVTNGGVGNANAFGPNPGIAAWPYQQDGATLLFDPRQGCARALSYVSSSVSDTTVTITVSGWDVYGVPMTETATLNGTTAVAGLKAFKSIKSVTTGVASLVGNVSVGTGATGANANGRVGLALRSDSWSYIQAYVADAGLTANTGFTKADLSVASATTGDVRGTYGLQVAANGTTRVAIYVNPTQYQWSQSTNLSPQLAFGMPQF